MRTMDLNRPLLWVLSVGFVLALLGVAYSQVQLSGARADLADANATHARAMAERAGAALKDAGQVVAAQSAHAESQQEATSALTKPDPQLAAALADNRALAGRLRDTSAQLAAARDRPQGDGDPAACRVPGDQLRTVLGLLEEAGLLSAEGTDLAAKSRSVVARRDAEVHALKLLIEADRTLMQDGAGRPMGAPKLAPLLGPP